VKPKLTRRQIVIAAIAVFVALVVWWNWPRGDARFVGQWKMEYHPPSSMDGTLWLHSNGSSYWMAKGNRTRASSPWSVSENRFYLGETLKPSNPLRIVATWFFRLTGYHSQPGSEVFGIIEVGQDRIILHSLTDGPATLTRIPE
jgi:hypothetical protein